MIIRQVINSVFQSCSYIISQDDASWLVDCGDVDKMHRSLYRRQGFQAFLATSFLGAFNDNFFKLIVTCFAISKLGKEELNTYVPLTGAMFVLPYLLCSSYAGYLADRFEKRRMLIWTKQMELVVMLFGLQMRIHPMS